MRHEPKWLRGEFCFEKIVKIMMNQYVGNEPNRLGTIPGRTHVRARGRSPLGMFSGKEFLFRVLRGSLPEPYPKTPIWLRRNEEKRLIWRQHTATSATILSD